MVDKLDEVEAKVSELEKLASEKLEALKKERDELRDKAENLNNQVGVLRKDFAEKVKGYEEQVRQLQDLVSAYAPFDNMIRTIIRTEFSNVRKELTDEVLKEIMDRVQEQFGRPLPEVKGEIQQKITEIHITRVVSELNVSTDTSEGMLGYMTTKETVFDTPQYAPALVSELRMRGLTMGDTAIYKVLDKLVSIGLLRKKRDAKGLVYYKNPDWEKWVRVVEHEILKKKQ